MRRAWVTVDLGFGDQGKGSVCDVLVRRFGAHTVVRYNGGAQAAHTVVLPDGRHHTFAQLGAGSFVPGVETLLAERVVISPWTMLIEARRLAEVGVGDGLARTAVDGRCVVATPYHAAANRARELARGAARHGSCGLGIGEAVVDARRLGRDETLSARELGDPATTRAKLTRIRERKLAELRDDLGTLESLEMPDFDRDLLLDPEGPEHLSMFIEEVRERVAIVDESAIAARLSRDGSIVFEGAHGVLLDEEVGFHPYSTWARTTDHHAHTLLADAGFEGEVTTLGLLRAYATRHGPGPLPTEDPALSAALPEAHNPQGPWQGAFRVGWHDALTTRYALAACARVDALAVSCLDRVGHLQRVPVATAYEIDGARIEDLPKGVSTDLMMRARPCLEEVPPGALAERIAALAGRPLALSSRGPTWRDKTWHTPWSKGQ